jgi:hypothetical protein
MGIAFEMTRAALRLADSNDPLRCCDDDLLYGRNYDLPPLASGR